LEEGNLSKTVSILLLAAFSAAGAAPAPSLSLQKLLSEGQDHLAAGRFEEAVSRFRSVLASRPNMPEALFGLGVACPQLGRLQEAQEALRHYLRLRPSSADGHSALGMVLLAAGRPAAAKVELERALRLEPDSLETAKALAYIETGEYQGERAVALLKPFEASPEFDEGARLLLASGYAESGNPSAAIALLGPLLERQPPPSPEVFVLAAGSGSRAGDTAFAERACALGMRLYLNSDGIEQRCLRIVPMSFVKGLEASLRGSAEDVPVLILLGRLMTDVTETAEAPIRERGLKLLERAAALSPSDAAVLYNLGRCLRVLARPQEAIPILERALRAQPDEELQALIYTQIALSQQYLQRDTSAENAFRRAMELNRRLARHLPEPAFRFYTFLVAVNKEPDAAAVLDEILRWDPGFLPARMQRARKLLDAGHLEEAAGQAEVVARNTSPADQELLRAAHILLLQVCAKLGRTEEASRHQAWLKNAQAARQP
jgi:tetratricopeptide (TPR) repeat protein